MNNKKYNNFLSSLKKLLRSFSILAVSNPIYGRVIPHYNEVQEEIDKLEKLYYSLEGEKQGAKLSLQIAEKKLLRSKILSEYEQKYSNERNNSSLVSSERKVSEKIDSPLLSHKAPITDQECLYEEIDFSHSSKLTSEINIVPHNAKRLSTENPPIYENINPLLSKNYSLPLDSYKKVINSKNLSNYDYPKRILAQTDFFKLNLRPTISSFPRYSHERNTFSSFKP